MKRHKIRLRYPKQRSILSDMLPYEVPPSFSNRHFFEFVRRHHIEFREDRLEWCCVDSRLDVAVRLIFGVKPSAAVNVEQVTEWGRERSLRYFIATECESITIPLSFKISHKDTESRTLSICHPRNQLRVADFYYKYSSLIIYYAGLSPFSIRKPTSVAKLSYYKDRLHSQNLEFIRPGEVEEDDREYEQIGNYFSYYRYRNVHKFFESTIYHRSEKKFDALLQVDVSKCFDSIYTHSIAWALLGKRATKDNISASRDTFGGRFDTLMQHMNDSETNGILIGPEFSRVFAELIMQSVDCEVERRLEGRSIPLIHKKDYEIFRYVDDYFIFYNRNEDASIISEVLSECLSAVKLGVNASKTVVYKKPIITEMTVAKDRISTLFNELLCCDFGLLDISDGLTPIEDPAYRFKIDINSSRLIVKFKTILKESNVDYKDILNYSLSIIENKIDDILSKFNAAASDQRSGRELTDALVGIVDFVFFLYASSPRVGHTVRVSRIVSTLVKFFENNPLGYELKHVVYKIIHDNIIHHLNKHRLSEFREVENLYLLIAVGELGRDYRIDEVELAEYFGFGRDSALYESSRPLSYFSITVGLRYMRSKVRYDALRAAFEAHAIKRIRAREGYCRKDTETLMLALDLLTCPYVSANTKSEIGLIYGLSIPDLESLMACNDHWFTAWESFDVHKELDAKRSRDVY